MMRVRVMKLKKTSLAVAAALALGGTSAVHAEIGLKAGAWDLSLSGNVNGFATWNSCDTSATAVRGGLACNNGLGGGKEQAIESGLLPSALVFGAKTSQSGFDIGWTIGLYPVITSSATGQSGIGRSNIDARQNFLTFGTKTGGTVKVGKDIGLFGSDAILSDMTLLGVGSGGAFLGGNTTLGRICVRYIYPDWIPQITYASPRYGGVQYAVGGFEGVLYAYTGDGIGTPAVGFGAAAFNGVTLEKRKSKGWYAQGTYKIGKWKPGISYGESKLDLASNESVGTNPNLVRKNKSLVLGMYYSLTPSLNLVAEYIPTTAQNQAGQEIKDKVIALGAILFF